MKALFTFLSVILMTLAVKNVEAQANALNPNDPDVVFSASYQPAAPAWNNYNITKWGHSNVVWWSPYSRGYKSYIYKGMAFRLKFPKSYQHGVSDGKKYPVFVFLHGYGEYSNIYDNELQLANGGLQHVDSVNSGAFDGFLLFPQSTYYTLQGYFPYITEVIDTMVKYVKADEDRVIESGLSGGGQASWEFLQGPYAKKIAAALPISAAAEPYISSFPNHITIPIWVSNGGQDNNPAPYTVTKCVQAYRDSGGKIIQTIYPDQGHGIWNSFWAEPGYMSFLNSVHKANPLVYGQRTEFCPSDVFSVKLGLQAGFFAYEWAKNDVTIPGQTSNNLLVSTFGTYKGRFKRTATSNWSEWSPTPAVISPKQATVTPPIQVNGLKSSVLPAPDGSTTVPLFVPNNYVAYEWRRISDNALVSTSNTYNAPVGQYKLMVTEQFGCSSAFSAPYTVVSASGPNAPDKATNLSAVATSYNTVQLDWNDNPTPVNNETAFEIYRSTTQGGNYQLVAVKAANVLSHLDNGLAANTKYYYRVRAINTTGASAVSDEANASTLSDIIAPTAPTDLTVTGSTVNSVTLSWTGSTDNIGVYKYDIYINGAKAYNVTAPTTTYTVYNLLASQPYAFTVKARDVAGNVSPSSNQVTGVAVASGLSYKYYHGSWTSLPDFNALTPVATGTTSNINLNPRQQNDQFGFLWQGTINIPVTGTYTFQTISDDGSKLYIDVPYTNAATALINNDLEHPEQAVSASIFLTAGAHSIACTFFENGGGEGMRVYWQCAAAGIPDLTLIPDAAFVGQVVLGATPNKPGFLTAIATSYKAIGLTWTDNSTDETSFEIVRSTDRNGTYSPVATVAAGVTNYVDSVGLSPATKYYYKIRSLNINGASPYVSVPDGMWGLNNDFLDASSNFRNLTGVGSPTFSSTDKKEGTHSILLNGTSQYADLTFGSSGLFPSNAYNARTVAMWIKPLGTVSTLTNRVVFDFGGSDNGIALRFNSNVLQAGLASGSVRFTAVVNSIATDPNWVSGGWNHVAVVYDVNTLKLFLNGVEKASTTLTGVTSVPTTTGLSRIGATNGSNAFNGSAANSFFNGYIDDVVVLSEPVNATSLAPLMTQSYTSDTTFAVPAVPAVPTALVATAQSPSKIGLTWNDNSNNETSFEVFRSAINNTNYRLLAIVNAGTVSYVDSNLFANTNYYYKVRAVGVGGNSAFTAEATAKTLNNKPVIVDVVNFSMRYDAQKTIIVNATDIDGEALTMTILNKPAFATFTPGNGTATLFLNPATIGNQGTYPISIIATDGNGGKDTTAFTVIVNANYTPVINAVINPTLGEGTTSSVALTATDQDGNGTLAFSMTTGPSFATLVNNGNGSASLNLAPGYAHAGTHPVTISVADGAGGLATVSFLITVNNVEVLSEDVYMSMRYDGPLSPAPWNNIGGVTTASLLNSAGQATPIGIQFLATPWNAGNAGAQTTNNSGIYPDAVLRDYFWFGVYYQPETVDVRLTGLVPSAKYNVTIMGSSAWTGLGNNGSTIYTINGVAKPLYVDNNTQNTVTFTSISPDASGNITIKLSKAAGAPYGVLTSIVLKKPFDDGTSPVLPTNLTATALANGSIRLNWNDVAYNESGYQVYRSTTLNGTYTLLNPALGNANDVTYTDNTVASTTTYFYKIAAINSNGTSGQTAAVSATTGNKAPVLTPISDIVLKGGASIVQAIAATDDPGVLTTTITGLPSFGVYQSTGNGTGNITFTPTVNDLGVYRNVIVKVTDPAGASSSDTFNVSVVDSSFRQVYINYGLSTVEGGFQAAAPWNNWLSYPWANTPYTGLKDDNNVNTGFSIKLLQQWNGGFNVGMITGNNSGIFPDGVMKTSIYATDNAAKTIQIDGLNPAKRYNIVFFTSHDAGPASQVTFASGAQSVVADAKYNSSVSVQLNGLIATGGTISVTATKNAAATYLNLNAMIIQEYNTYTALLRPYNLFAESILDSDKIKLTWSDRSANETGFQIWRATAPNGTYTLVTTTAANATTYTNTGVTPNVRYYYKLRAVNGGVFSNYSNIATGITASKIVYINLNIDPAQAAPAPWNNLSGPSSIGSTIDLMNNSSESTGFQMVITKEFNGAGYAGETGAGGIFPGNVMTSNIWSDAGQTSEVKFTKLDVRKKYRIGCFGSAIFFGYAVANYTCNGQTVQLNSYKNTSKIVYLEGLTPDAEGELYLSVRNENGYPYTFTSAFTVEAYDDESNYVPVSLNVIEPGSETLEVEPNTNTEGGQVINATVIKPSATEELLKGQVKVYPNPFTNRIQVELSNEKASTVTVMLYDLNAKLVYRNATVKTNAGKNVISVNLPNALTPGSYVLNVLVDGQTTKSVKLIKIN